MSFGKTAIVRNIGIGILVLIGMASCERDLEDIAVNLAGQRPFDVGDTIFEVIAYNSRVDSNRVDNNDATKLPLFLMGLNRDTDFGKKESDMIAQVFLPALGVDFGDNPIIDQVVVDVPYYSTLDGTKVGIDPDTGLPITDEDGDTLRVPNFTLDSVYGDREAEYVMRVFELGTFLNVLDPNDPTKPNSYYSNRDYLQLDKLHEDSFFTNANDTVLYVERRFLDGDPLTVDDIDTIKRDNAAPSMKFQLDEQFFYDRFINHDNPSDFDNNDNFVRYFRGLYFEAVGEQGALINTSAISARMTIYYSNDEIVDEPDDQDLNGNGIDGETGVTIKVKQTMEFPFGGVRLGRYEQDYGGTLLQNLLINPNKEEGETDLFVQGAAGSEAIIELFTDEQLEELRAANLLINEARLVVYLDGEQGEIPDQLFLYKKDFNSFVDDFYDVRFGPDQFDGNLDYDDDGNPVSYTFRITGYLSDVLKADEPKALSKLALKNYVRTDLPDFALLDTTVPDWNWIPKGVKLHGNRPASNEKRIKLQIFFSKNP